MQILHGRVGEVARVIMAKREAALAKPFIFKVEEGGKVASRDVESELQLLAVMNSATMVEADFDAVLVSELEALREGEERLTRLYPQLRKKPQLRDRFLSEFAEVKRRAERLHAILNPYEAFEVRAAEYASPGLSPAA